jgi:tetratricopeptide (TPR) repeat protein
MHEHFSRYHSSALRHDQQIYEALCTMTFAVDRELAKAGALLNQRLYAEAELVYRRILDRFPKNMRALREMEKLRKLPVPTSSNSERVIPHFNRLVELYRQGKFEEIVSEGAGILQEFPDAVGVLHIVGAAHQGLQKFDTAIACFLRALTIDPGLVDVLIALGSTYRESGETLRAINCFNEALRLRPENPIIHFNLGNAFRVAGNVAAAEQSYRAALRRKPDLAQAHAKLANLLSSQGDLEGAAHSYERALAIAPDFAECYRDYANIKTFEPGDQLIERMRVLVRSKSISSNHEMHLKLALAKAERDIGNISSSFDFLNAANANRKHALAYTIEKDERLFARIKEHFSVSESCPENLDHTAQSQQPIFILGMPRSGTTLVEQILSSHSKVYGGGELEFLAQIIETSGSLKSSDPSSVSQTIRTKYAAKLSNLSECRFITDKMPLNFRWIGFILSAFTEARIIHLKRNPMAVCWSNYNTYFPAAGLGFCFDQEDIARYYRLYEDLMAFWHAKFPGQIYDLTYEALTENQEAETRALLDYVGLPWEDHVLTFHTQNRGVRTASSAQVRQKMFQGSSEEWQKYAEFLKPMRRVLA